MWKQGSVPTSLKQLGSNCWHVYRDFLVVSLKEFFNRFVFAWCHIISSFFVWPCLVRWWTFQTDSELSKFSHFTLGVNKSSWLLALLQLLQRISVYLELYLFSAVTYIYHWRTFVMLLLCPMSLTSFVFVIPCADYSCIVYDVSSFFCIF